MNINFYNYWSISRELEWNFSWGIPSISHYPWSLRFGTHQLALWRNGKALLDFQLRKRTEAESVSRHEGL